MRQWLLALVAAGALCVACFLSYPLFRSYALLELRGPVPVMEAGVKVFAGSGSGSGIHIGGGNIITAAHVISDAKDAKVEYFGGGTVKAEILWINRKYDIAMIRVERKRWGQAAPLDCSPTYVGQRVTHVGNPMDVTFVYTRGEVVGNERAFGPWAAVVPVDSTIIYGQSGGGVVNDLGRVVGITVGLVPTPYGISAFGWVVPAHVVCGLMGRA